MTLFTCLMNTKGCKGGKRGLVERQTDLHACQGAVPWECCLWQHEHQNISTQMSSDEAEKRREEGKEAGREDLGWGHTEAEALRIKRENRLRSAIQLWSKGSGLQRLYCVRLQRSLVWLINAAACSHYCTLIFLLAIHVLRTVLTHLCNNMNIRSIIFLLLFAA